MPQATHDNFGGGGYGQKYGRGPEAPNRTTGGYYPSIDSNPGYGNSSGGYGQSSAPQGYGRGAGRSSYTNTNFNQDFSNGHCGLDLGGGPMGYGNGTRGFGTGELKSYGYMGPPPQLQKGLSMHPSGMSGGPVRAMDMGYDKQSYGGSNIKGGGPSGNYG